MSVNPSIRYVQNGAGPAAGTSRDDLVLGAPVTCSDPANLDSETRTWSFLYVPSGSAATMGSVVGAAQSASFTPDVPGSYRVKCATSHGETSSSIAAAKTPTSAIRIPAGGETQEFGQWGWAFDVERALRVVDNAALFNVRDYGALGNGSDDSVAIQRAGDLAAAASGVLFFPKGLYSIGLASSNATWGDAYGGVKLGNNVAMAGVGPSSRLVRGTNANYVVRVVSSGNVEIRDVAVDVAADANFRAGVYCLAASNLRLRRVLFTNSTVLTPGWTIHGVLPYSMNELTVEDCRFVRCQQLGGGDTLKATFRRNRSINAFNQGISVVSVSTGTFLRALTIEGNYYESPQDSGIYFGADGATTYGDFHDVTVRDNVVLGFGLNRGIFGRFGANNRNWKIAGNRVAGAAANSTVVSSSVTASATSFKVPLNSGSQYPGSGWMYLGLGTTTEECVRYVRTADTFALDRPITYPRTAGDDVWGQTSGSVNNVIGIHVTPADDLGAIHVDGLTIDDNEVENLDLYGIQLDCPLDLSRWSISNNKVSGSRGIYVAGSSTRVWRPGSISNNALSDCNNYGIRVDAGTGRQGLVAISDNVVRKISGGFGTGIGISLEAGVSGTLRAHLVGNVVSGTAVGVSEVTSSGPSAIFSAWYVANDFNDNTVVALLTTGSYARSNRGLADQGGSYTFGRVNLVDLTGSTSGYFSGSLFASAVTASDRLYVGTRVEVGAANCGWSNFAGSYISVLGSGLTQGGEWYIVNDGGTGDGNRTYFASQNGRNLVFIADTGKKIVASGSLKVDGSVTASNGASIVSGRLSFGIVAVSQTLSAAQLTATLDLSQGNVFTLTTLTAQTLLTASNPLAGQSFTVRVVNGVANGILGYASAFKFPAGLGGTIGITSGSFNVISGICFDTSRFECAVITGSA